MRSFAPALPAPPWLRKAARLAAWAVPALLAVPVLHGLTDLRLKSREPSLHLLDRNFAFIGAVEGPEGDFGYWALPDTLPETLVMATLAAEDRRFRRHPGIDPAAVAGSAYSNLFTRRPRRGASTLAMQVARIQRGGGGGWYGKARDAAAALGMTAFHGRDGVLRQYLVIAPYGNRISGAACAARRYFRKPVQDLSLAEAALLAALPKAPSRLNPFHGDGFAMARRRAALIVRRARDYGWITPAAAEASLLELQGLKQPVKELRGEGNLHYLRACAGRIPPEAGRRGEVRTALDLRIQDTLNAVLAREAPRLLKWEAGNAAALVLDARSGEVLAYAGSFDYFDPRGGAIDCARVPRSTGSLLKPFIYAQGMDWRGFTPASVLTDVGHDFGTGGRPFQPENMDRRFQGPVLYRNALANSRNIPAVQVLDSVGVEEFYRLCIALGLARDDGRAAHYGLGLSIGGLYASLQQVAAAYLALANRGRRGELSWILDAAGKPVYADSAATGSAAPRVLSPGTAMQIMRFLSDPVARLPGFPRGGNLEYPFAVAVKTGTSEGHRDSWCVGISDRYLVGVWMGNADFRPTKKLTGYGGAAALVRQVLFRLHPDRVDGQSDIDFPRPPGYRPVSICRLTGRLADRATPYVATEHFAPGTEPVEYSQVQRLLPVDAANGLLAFPGCRARIRYRRFTLLPPEFRDWAEAQGLEVPPDRYSPACGAVPPVDSFAIAITAPLDGSRLILDPEMPAGQSRLALSCRVQPRPANILWLWNGEEYRVTAHPFTLSWPMQPGRHRFQAVVPGTPFKSREVRLEVF
jgi:penicillin-binding protein 1C